MEGKAKIHKAEEKVKVFKAGFSNKTIVPLIVPIIVASILIWYGIHNDPLFPIPEDPMRAIFIYLPIGFGAFIIFFAILTIIDNMMIQLIISKEYLIAKKGSKEMKVNWRILAYAPPYPGRKYLRTFTIGDGKTIIRVNEIFFPKFDTVVKLIKTAKDAASQAGYDV